MRRTVTCLLLAATMLLSLSGWAEDKKPAKADEKTLNQLAEERDWPKFLERAQKYLDEGTADFGIYCNLGNAYLDMKDYPKAIEYYTQAAGQDPSSAIPLQGMAAAYVGQDDKASALDALSKAAAIDSALVAKYAELAYDAGMDLYGKQDFAGAEPFMQKAFEAKGDYFEAALGYAQCLQRQKKYAEAVPVFEKVVELNTEESKNIAFLLKLLECKYFGKQYTEAVLTAEKVLGLRPNDEKALLFRAGSYLELKDCAKAVPAIESFLAVSQNAGTRLGMMKGAGRCLYDQKKYAEAAKFYDQANSIKGDDEDVLLYGGNSYLQLKNNAKALPYFKKLVATTKDAGLKANAQKTVNTLSKGK